MPDVDNAPVDGADSLLEQLGELPLAPVPAEDARTFAEEMMEGIEELAGSEGQQPDTINNGVLTRG